MNSPLAFDSLRTKAVFQLKRSSNVIWNEQEKAVIQGALDGEDWVGSIAAAVVVSLEKESQFPKALSLLQWTIQQEKVPIFVELLTFEALTSLCGPQLVDIAEPVMVFSRRSCISRRINLDNTIVVLGRLKASGNREATELIDDLSEDIDLAVRNQARCFL